MILGTTLATITPSMSSLGTIPLLVRKLVIKIPYSSDVLTDFVVILKVCIISFLSNKPTVMLVLPTSTVSIIVLYSPRLPLQMSHVNKILCRRD